VKESNNILAAESIWQAYQTKVTCSPVREIIGETNVDTAYAVQNINTARFIANGAKPIGCKIGLTSLAVQKQLGVNQPDYGVLFDFMHVANGGEIAWQNLMQPKAETELAFILGADLNQAELDEHVVANAVDYVCAAIEIVGSRVHNWDIKITDTIADNASSSHFVLGDIHRKINEIDLPEVEMKLYKNDILASEGKGSACLGSPLIAATWLAKTMHSLGNPLRKGDIILTGALGPMCAGVAGDFFKTEVSGFGTVEVSFKA